MPVTINGSTGLTSNNGSVFTDSNGNAGIGTSTPVERLQIVGTGDLKAEILTNSTNNVAFRWKNGSNSYIWQVIGGAFRVFDETAGADRLRISSAGYVTTPSQPSFSAYSNNGVSITTSTTPRVMPYANLLTNIGSCYSSNRFTAPVAGTYFFSCSALLLGGGSGNLVLFKNGSSIGGSLSNARAINGTNESTISQAITVTLAANDFVEAYYYNDGGSNQFYGAHGSFCGTLLG